MEAPKVFWKRKSLFYVLSLLSKKWYLIKFVNRIQTTKIQIIWILYLNKYSTKTKSDIEKFERFWTVFGPQLLITLNICILKRSQTTPQTIHHIFDYLDNQMPHVIWMNMFLHFFIDCLVCLFFPLRMVPMVWIVKNAVTAIMLMDVTTLLVTAAVWLDGRVIPNYNVPCVINWLWSRQRRTQMQIHRQNFNKNKQTQLLL